LPRALTNRAGLSTEASQERYAEERRQGEAIARRGLEPAWGWSSPAGSLRAARRAEFMIQAAGLRPGATCLELGCGTGVFTARLIESGCDLAAVELSEAAAERCRQRVRGRADVIVGNIETGEGLDGRSFDAIVGVSVLHHVNMELCLENTIVPHLEAGGRFAFSEPNWRNPQVWTERNVGVVRRWRHVTAHETAFRVSELRSLFASRGFRVDVCEPFEFLPPSTPPSLIGAVLRVERRLEATPLRAIAGSIRIAGSRP
jgi:SAM-dependent methyltransferase